PAGEARRHRSRRDRGGRGGSTTEVAIVAVGATAFRACARPLAEATGADPAGEARGRAAASRTSSRRRRDGSRLRGPTPHDQTAEAIHRPDPGRVLVFASPGSSSRPHVRLSLSFKPARWWF